MGKRKEKNGKTHDLRKKNPTVQEILTRYETFWKKEIDLTLPVTEITKSKISEL
jgi:hypothetical protein